MKVHLTSMLLLVAVTALPASALAEGAGSEFINMKERFNVEGKKKAVIFTHWKHQEKTTCLQCHQTKEGEGLLAEINRKAGVENDFHQKICWPCHMEMNVPEVKSCRNCHK